MNDDYETYVKIKSNYEDIWFLQNIAIYRMRQVAEGFSPNMLMRFRLNWAGL